MMEAFIHAAAIALGVGIGMAIFGSKFIGTNSVMILQIVGAFVAMYWFAVLIETPKKYLPMAGVVASIGWFVYLSCENQGADAVLATFFSALTVTFISHVLARKLRHRLRFF